MWTSEKQMKRDYRHWKWNLWREPVGTGGFFPGGKVAREWSWPLTSI